MSLLILFSGDHRAAVPPRCPLSLSPCLPMGQSGDQDSTSLKSITLSASGTVSGFVPSAPTGLSAAVQMLNTLTWVAHRPVPRATASIAAPPPEESGTAIATGVSTTTALMQVDGGSYPAVYYVVEAVGTGGTSAASNEASATTTAEGCGRHQAS